MAAEYGTIYTELNVLPNLELWNLTDAEVITDNYITIHSNGYIDTLLSDDINNGLKASKFRKVIMGIIDPQIDDTYNYENKVELFMDIVYKDLNGNETDSTNVTPFVLYHSILDLTSGLRRTETELTMLNMEMTQCKVTLRNNTDHDITVRYVYIYRSNDLTGQLSGGGDTPTPQPTQMGIGCTNSNWTLNTINDECDVYATWPASYNLYYNDVNATFELVDGYPNTRLHYTSKSSYLGPNLGIKHTLKGIRNGIVKVTFAINSGSHAGEKVEHNITIINCDPGHIEINFTGAAEVNGFNGTVAQINMKPYPWYPYYTESSTSGYTPPFANGVAAVLRLNIGDSIDGGEFTFGRGSYQDVLDGLANGDPVTFYGVWNGRQVVTAYVKTGSLSSQYTKWDDIVITIVNCDHVNYLKLSQGGITSLDETVNVVVESNPPGAPINVTENKVSPYSWDIPAELVAISLTGGDIKNPSAVVKAASDLFSGTVGISCVVENGGKGEFELITASIMLTMEQGAGISYRSSSGEFVIKRYNTNIFIYVDNAPENFAPGFSVLSNGGTATLGSYDKTNKRIQVTGLVVGLYDIIVTDSAIGYTGTIHMENNYTEWLDSLEVISSSEGFEINTYNASITLKIPDLPVSSISGPDAFKLTVAKSSLDTGVVNVNNSSSVSQTLYTNEFSVTGLNEGKALVTMSQPGTGLFKTAEITMDYTEWKNSIVPVSNTGEFKITSSGGTIQVFLQGFNTQALSVILSQSSEDGGRLSTLSYATNNQVITMTGAALSGGKTQATVYVTIRNTTINYTKVLEIQLDYS